MNMECRDVLKCLFNIDENEIAIYKLLLKKKMRVNEIGGIAGRDRSTVQRCLQKLIKCGMVSREKRILEGGGYYYLYKAIPPNELKKWLLRCINRWQKEMREAIKKIEEEII